jgi:hypothetical protein
VQRYDGTAIASRDTDDDEHDQELDEREARLILTKPPLQPGNDPEHGLSFLRVGDSFQDDRTRGESSRHPKTDTSTVPNGVDTVRLDPRHASSAAR